MRRESDFLDIDLLLEDIEGSIRKGSRNLTLIGERDLNEDTYRMYPYAGSPFLLTRGEFGALLLGRFSPRLSLDNQDILRRIVKDLDEGQLGSGFQHLPLQERDEVVGSRRLVLQCLIDRGSLNGQSPFVSWHIIPDTMVDYFESEASKTRRILIDG